MALRAKFDFAMSDFATPMLARALTFELDDADLCFGEIGETVRLARPSRESMA